MKDWKNISSEFTEELQAEWEIKRFSYEECKEWVGVGLQLSDADYACWLRDIKKVGAYWVLENDDQTLRREYQGYLERKENHNDNWKGIKHPLSLVINFTPELQKEWEDKGFDKRETKKWLSIGMGLSDSDYCAWLRDVVQENPKNISSYGDDLLRSQYVEYLNITDSADKEPVTGEKRKFAILSNSETHEKTKLPKIDEIKASETNKDNEQGSRWKNIDLNFTKALQKEWENKGFGYETCKEWIDIGLKVSDADYAKWLRDIKNVNSKWVLDCENNEQLKKEYKDYSISRWHNKGFTDEEISAWSSVGLGLQDGGYAAWLRDILKITPKGYSDCLDEGNDKLLRGQWQTFLEERREKRKLTEDNEIRKDICFDFTSEQQPNWEEREFSYEEHKEWIDADLATNDVDFADRLREQSYVPEEPLNNDYCLSEELLDRITRLDENIKSNPREEMMMESHAEDLLYSSSDEENYKGDWSNIHPSFTTKLQEEWENKGFNYDQVKRWVKIGGLGIEESNFAKFLLGWGAWSPEGIAGATSEKIKELKEDYINNKVVKEYFYNNAQEWLDSHYHKKLRNKIKRLDIAGKNLRGNLDLRDFTNLESLYCQNNQLTGLNLSKNVNLITIWCSNNQINELELKNCQRLVDLYCNNNQLTRLFLTSCHKLRELNCWSNQLINLDLPKNCTQLGWLCCSNNQLSNCEFLNKLNSKSLTHLSIDNNNFSRQHLSIFSRFIELWSLSIGTNNQSNIRKGIYNRFYGSLASLKDLTKLWTLGIESTDIDGGLEYLPKKLKLLYCKPYRKEAEVKIIYESLRSYRNQTKYGLVYTDIKRWRKNESQSTQKAKDEEVKKKIENLYQKIHEKIRNEKYNDLQTLLVELEKETKGRDKIMNEAYLIKTVELQNKLRKTKEERDAISKKFELSRIEVLFLKDELGKKKNNERLLYLEKEKSIYVVSRMPSQWRDALKEENKLEENHDIEKIFYGKIHHEKPSPWKNNTRPLLPLEKLPLRLYDVTRELKKEKLEELKANIKTKKEYFGIKHYAILSHFWGEKNEKEILSFWGEKSFMKAIEACRHLDIDYLWMDQLCIDQNNIEEQNQEVPRMRDYYNNATVTLVTIHTNLRAKNANLLPPLEEIVKIIISSEWFTRSWTYQEGWLSKQTIFMFDDVLIDGRAVAQAWVSNQPIHIIRELPEGYKEDLAKVATPLGWAYYKNGYGSEDKVSLSLNQALREIKNRKRVLPIDGIYSILGLLPYGEKVVVKYKEWGHQYTKKDLEESLRDVMQVALKEGYGELFAWHGIGNELLPDIIDAEKGSVGIAGGINLTCKKDDYKKVIKFTPEGVEISGSKYIISNIGDDLRRIEEKEGFLIEGGLCAKDVWVKINGNSEQVTLSGTREVLEKMKNGNILVVLSESDWESDKHFSLVVNRKGNIYFRIGLVEVEKGAEKLKENEEKKLVIGMKTQGDENWKTYGSPFLDFTEIITKEWIKRGFENRWECKQWLDVGLKAQEYEYAKWLKEIEQLVPEQVLKEDDTELHELFQEYKKEKTRQCRNKVEVLAKKNNSVTRNKRQLSVSSQMEVFQQGTKLLKMDEEQELFSESRRGDNQDWQSTYSNFTPQPIQKLLNKNYPVEKRKEVSKLNLGNQNLERLLVLEGFTNLKELDCSNNQLTSLDISMCSGLTSFNCSSNQLTNISEELNKLPRPEKLTYLNIWNNNISPRDLTFLIQFTELRRLELGNYSNDGVRSYFFGSLEPLKNMTKLKYLDISFTDIDSGIEYLPKSLEKSNKFYCDSGNTDSKVVKIYEQLEPYSLLIYKWKQNNPDLVNKAKKSEKIGQNSQLRQEHKAQIQILPK